MGTRKILADVQGKINGVIRYKLYIYYLYFTSDNNIRFDRF